MKIPYDFNTQLSKLIAPGYPTEGITSPEELAETLLKSIDYILNNMIIVESEGYSEDEYRERLFKSLIKQGRKIL